MGKKPAKQTSATPPKTAAAATAAPSLPTTETAPSRHYFHTEDWLAAAVTFLISGLAFFYYMSPEVTLQDSGELVTGAFHFGVPHPPGYPLWAFLGWVWRHLIPFGNPAWRICLMSVLTGALVVGFLTVLMTRSTLMLLRTCPWADAVEDRLKHWIALTVGATAALLFGFNRGVWLWACVPEMRVLNVFMFTLTAFTFFAWMMRPERHAALYTTILVYGLGISNHQTIVVMVVPFMVGAVALEFLTRDRGRRLAPAMFRTTLELLVAILLSAAAWSGVMAWVGMKHIKEFVPIPVLGDMPLHQVAVLFLVAGAALCIGGSINRWLSWKRALICAAVFLLGVSFYAYMPLASSTNPPMNWGYTSTRQGFLHHITRGQYERLHIAQPFSEDFFIQIRLFTRALVQQYSTGLCLFALGVLVALVWWWRRFNPRGRAWLIFVWAAFLTTSVGLLTIINPGLDKQNQEINIKFFAPAHGFFAMLIGYGIALAAAALLARWKNRAPFLPSALRVACVGLLALPLIPYSRNWSICEQRGHDFGYQFGYRMFYPGGGYEPMARDAVLFGGTDPGRFVPTYMIFCESRVPPQHRFQDSHFDPEGGRNFDRRDVYIITQNALADNTYMNYIRDHYDYSRPDATKPETLLKFAPWQRAVFRWAWRYLDRASMYPKEPIYIPTETDMQRAFQEYVESVRNRPVGPEERVDIDASGRVSVRGVAGVMKINGILTRWIFERNKDKHEFYVEESYVIDWMYPYLTPFGIIMKINKEPLPSPQEAPELWAQIVARDRAYWDKLEAEFEARPEFRRDNDAQKTFSKLRSAIGGIYAWRRMANEAEYAFQQARRLCPESPEANFRLAQLYSELNRMDDAIGVLTELQRLDPLNRRIKEAVDQLRSIKAARDGLAAMEATYMANPRSVQALLQLAQAYGRAGLGERVLPLADSYLSQPDLPASDMVQVAQLFLSMGHVDKAVAALRHIISRHPNDSQAYYALAILRAAQGGIDEALQALEKAIQITPALREQARRDAYPPPGQPGRLQMLARHPRFQQLVGGPLGLPAPSR